MRDFMEFILCCVFIFAGIMLFIFTLSLPIVYMEGSAKSEYLKESKNIDISWYRAAFLPDTVFIDAKITGDKQ